MLHLRTSMTKSISAIMLPSFTFLIHNYLKLSFLLFSSFLSHPLAPWNHSFQSLFILRVSVHPPPLLPTSSFPPTLSSSHPPLLPCSLLCQAILPRLALNCWLKQSPCTASTWPGLHRPHPTSPFALPHSLLFKSFITSSLNISNWQPRQLFDWINEINE